MTSPVSNLPNTQSSAAQSTTQSAATNTDIRASAISSTLRTQLNSQIIESSLNVSISAGNNPQELLFRSVLDKIYEAMGPELNTTPPPTEQDNSPEATADRILSLSLGFFDAYAAQHPGKDKEQLANDFVKLIRGGFEKGFKEASDILDSMNALNGVVTEGIQKTYELVQKGYDDFITAHTTKPETKPAPTPEKLSP